MITSWSPSKLEKYEQCPKKAKLETVDKLCPICFKGSLKGWEVQTCSKCGGSPPRNDTLDRGTMLHKEAEDYILGRRVDMHDDLKPVASWLVKYRLGAKKGLVRVEQQIALDRNWKPVEWFAKSAWLRTKIDVLDMTKKSTWEVSDWKTGKYKPDGEYSDQLNVYSTAILSYFTQAKKVTSRLIFIDAGKDVDRPEGAVKASDLKKAQARWDAKTKAMLSDTIFPPKPSYLCRYCPFSKAKGGPCEF